jgi:hypothetical protein
VGGGQPSGDGVAFPALDGERGTTPTGRGILADAARAADGALADRIEGIANWRSGYLPAVRDLTAAGGRSPAAAAAVAAAGLASMRARMVLRTRGGDRELASAATLAPAGRPESRTLTGTGRPARELAVPYRGRELRGAELRAQLEEWRDRGVVEPSFAAAVATVSEHPEWLRLEGRRVAVLGAGAELAPLAPLLAWGAHVLAADVPASPAWERIERLAREGAGTVTLPVRDGAPGIDLVAELPAARAWLLEAAGDDALVLGMYAYADRGRHVQVTAAVDVLAAELLAARPGTAYAGLATPTDAYLVDREILEEARARWARRGVRAALQAPLRAASRGRLLAPAYAHEVTGDDGSRWGVADVLVPQQGPNYALAKRLQRWRAILAERDGRAVSFNVAPAAWTRSVTRNRMLAAAYAGAHRFGIEIFAPDTSRVLMAALLVFDLHRPAAPRDRHPDALLIDGAAHGGLWRVPYEPRTALGLAALAGAPRILRGALSGRAPGA